MGNVPLFKIYSDENDINQVTKVIERGNYWAEGKEIQEFEEKIASYLGVKHALVFNSGTSAQTSILEAYDIRDGDEVLVPSFTFISTVNCVKHTGAVPVFVDIEPNLLGMSPTDLRSKITPKTKAVIPVHYAGAGCQIEEIREICEENDLLLIEDNAESFGASIGNRKLGSIGDCAFLSFCQNKVISTGEGGAVVTDDTELYEKLKLIRSHGRSTSDYFVSSKKADYVLPGYNYRMPTMNAALGIAQMDKVDFLIAERKKVAKKYNDSFDEIDGLQVIQKNFTDHVYQLYSILTTKGDRDELIQYLAKHGIASKVYFDPVHQAEYYKGYPSNSLDQTEKISQRIITLPMYVNMDEKDQNHVINTVKKYFKEEI